MKNQLEIPKRAVAFLSVAMLGFAIRAWASPQSHEPASDSSPAANGTATRTGKMPPLEIAREGYVFAGGKYSTDKDAKVMSGQDLRGIPNSGSSDASLPDRIYATTPVSIP